MDTSFGNLHVAILSSPGISHLIPVLVLANRLATHHDVSVTVLQVTSAASPPPSNLPLRHHLVQMIALPPVDISHLVDSSTDVATQIVLMVSESLPSVSSAIAAADSRPDALFVDTFSIAALPIAADFNMAKYVYIPSTAWFTALTLYCPVLDQEFTGQYVDQPGGLVIPGCRPVRPEDVVSPLMDRNGQQYTEFIKAGKRLLLSDGILINSWKDLEPKTLRAFEENEKLRSVIKIPVYPIGPLRRPVTEGENDLTGWLNRQPDESVIFVSFGSGGMLCAEQIIELAWGLELSRQRFVWVVRPPTAGREDNAFLNACNGSDGTPNYLPEGFLTRTHNVGMLVQNWANQVEILTHPSIGGFLSHCGWNSTIESIMSGVPIIAWPLYAEQKMNATFLAEEAGVAVRPQILPTKKVVRREEIETMVRTLMEGKQGHCIKDKVKQLKMSAIEALKKDGSSHKSMCELLSIINSKKKTRTC